MACYFTSFLITSQVKQAVRDGLYFEYTSKKNPSWSQNDYFKATFYSFFTIVQMTFFDHWLTGIIRPMGEIQNTLAFLLMGVILVIQFGLVNNISGLFVAYVIKNGEQQRDQNRFVKEARRKAQLQLSAFLRMRELLDEHAQPCPYVRRRQMRRFRFRKSTAPDFNIEARGAHGSAMLFTKEDLEDVMRPPEPPLLLDALGKPLPDNLQPKDPEMTWKECQRALGIRADEVLEAYDIIHQADIDTHGFGVTTDAFLGALLVFAGDLKARDVHTLCCTARACIGKLDKLGESFKEANSGCSLIEITTERVHQLLFDMYECRGAPAPGAKGTAPVRYRNYPKPLPDIVEDPRAISSGVRVLDAEIAMKKRKEEAMLAEEAEKLGKSTWHFGMPKGHDYDAYYPERFKGRQEDDSSSSDEE
ncbi:unnamed protein product [Amoebophrya sp. A25]|nr:unnamed protein product [Amoebophrya sp. A25]|eukprot:GSA25T00017092001.1